jgi:hypothetical protein
VRPVNVTDVAVEDDTLGPGAGPSTFIPPDIKLRLYVYAPAPEPAFKMTVNPVLVKPLIGDAGKVGAEGEVPAAV